MNRQLFYNNAVFRLVAPILYGILLYLLILMFFDSVNMIIKNFFSNEVLFVIVLTFVLSESLRLCIVLLNKIYPVTRNLKIRILLQITLNSLLSVILVSLILFFYFIFIEGFSTIRTELITFNILYLLTVFFYNLFFFSMILLNLKNEDKVLKEQKLRENLEIELQSYKNQINPELLFQSLETIISELYRDKKSADDLINDLSKIYRYTLDNKHNDLVTLKEELESVKYLLSILNVRFHGKIKCNIQIDKDVLNLGIVPGVFLTIFEEAATKNIITEFLPLEIMIKNNKNSVNISYKLKKHLMDFSTKNNRIDFIRKAYEYYSQGGFIIREEGQLRFFEIPLLEIEEEN